MDVDLDRAVEVGAQVALAVDVADLDPRRPVAVHRLAQLGVQFAVVHPHRVNLQRCRINVHHQIPLFDSYAPTVAGSRSGTPSRPMTGSPPTGLHIRSSTGVTSRMAASSEET